MLGFGSGLGTGSIELRRKAARKDESTSIAEAGENPSAYRNGASGIAGMLMKMKNSKGGNNDIGTAVNAAKAYKDASGDDADWSVGTSVEDFLNKRPERRGGSSRSTARKIMGGGFF